MPNSVPVPVGISMSPTEATSEIPQDVVIRTCESHKDRNLCVELQRRIWGFQDEDLVPAAMFVVAQHTGGHAYCAFLGEEPVGFALAFSAEHHGRRVWHSHMVGVLPEFQNRGVGRILKLHQRTEALRLGIDTIEWTFDPLELRNAYFNIVRLGAIVRHYIPDCYGGTTSPLHGGIPTDRFVAEWRLAADRVTAVLAGKETDQSSGALEIRIPTAIREFKTSSIQCAREVQANLRNQCTDLFSRGYAVTGFRREPDFCTYILERYED